MQTMETVRDDEMEIDLQALFGFLIHWLWLITGCGIIAAAIGFSLSYFVITPMYQSTTKIYILNKQSENVTYSDLQTGTQLTNDYAQLIKGRTVLEQVIQICGLEESYGSLNKRVSVETITNTRIIAITVTDANPVHAQMIADEIRKVAAVHIKNVTDTQAVNTAENANLPTGPSSPNIMKWTVFGGAIGAFLCIMLLAIQFLLDDTIKTSEDVEKFLGLSTLAMIPIAEDEATRAKNKKKRSKSTSSSHRLNNAGMNSLNSNEVNEASNTDLEEV